MRMLSGCVGVKRIPRRRSLIILRAVFSNSCIRSGLDILTGCPPFIYGLSI